ncbi:extracellular solute-binding protein [Nonomuraea rubra]|uniref:Putative aldouronate transport system substrate-binding protein n=1 Tax=Nonomuraea rubra TaxID=46180 RepID=A0A7X0U076_9ACTN|nr:extracellular solute-binding protein [Nonomuraea rubra]MBB6550472.1 putative aldouronate transport system substrate-binding protein [Nonomuraea rubra]
MSDARHSRRQFLQLTGSTALLAASGGLLTACGPSSPQASPQAGTRKAVMPAYVPSGLVKPDLPATAEGVLAAYYSYPAEPVTAFTGKPGEGLGEVKVLTNMFNPVPPGPDANRFWQELNTRLGATLNVTMAPGVPASAYVSKLSTVIASGDLPDILMLSATLANRSQILTRLCADLSDLVSGDAVKSYPFLANIPRDSWLATAYQGGVYAIPIPRAIVGTIMFARSDLIAERGLSGELKSYDDFLALARGLTDPAKNRWAFGSAKGVITYVGTMLGVPNTWAEQGGRFTSEHEAEGRKEAIARTAEMVKAGLFHPDAIGGKLNLRDLFGNGTIALNSDGYAAWDILADTYKVDVGALVSPGPARAGQAHFAITAFKKAGRDRLAKLLRVCDWLSAPLGTSEYMFRKFGVEGTHYTMKDGAPEPTSLGKAEVKLPLEYVADAPHVLGPRPRERVDAQRAYQERVVPAIVRNPAAALYSDTAVNKGGTLTKIIDQAELDIVSGRKPVSHWDEVVKQWRAQGGDQIRRDYETALAKGD